MADDDFEIDIYDNNNDRQQEDSHGDSHDQQANDHDYNQDQYDDHHNDDQYDSRQDDHYDGDQGHGDDSQDVTQNQPPQQGVKRKGGSDDRPIDPGATSTILVSDLQWWHTDDEIRGWAQEAQCEEELKDITFSEHKVNGKSKG